MGAAARDHVHGSGPPGADGLESRSLMAVAVQVAAVAPAPVAAVVLAAAAVAVVCRGRARKKGTVGRHGMCPRVTRSRCRTPACILQSLSRATNFAARKFSSGVGVWC
jgi:hypothetical protein